MSDEQEIRHVIASWIAAMKKFGDAQTVLDLDDGRCRLPRSRAGNPFE